MAGKLKVQLLGTSFTLTSDQDSDYLETVYENYLDYVNRVRSEIQIKDPLKIAIIAGILAAENREKESEISAETDLLLSCEESKAIETITENLIEKLDSCLNESIGEKG